MSTLESDLVDRVLRSKMRAERQNRADWYYIIRNDQGIQISSTSISKGSKETLRASRIRDMARQLGFDTSQQFIDLIKCSLSREDALKIMQKNRPPGTPRYQG